MGDIMTNSDIIDKIIDLNEEIKERQREINGLCESAAKDEDDQGMTGLFECIQSYKEEIVE